jgi:hypothetical protein
VTVGVRRRRRAARRRSGRRGQARLIALAAVVVLVEGRALVHPRARERDGDVGAGSADSMCWFCPARTPPDGRVVSAPAPAPTFAGANEFSLPEESRVASAGAGAGTDGWGSGAGVKALRTSFAASGDIVFSWSALISISSIVGGDAVGALGAVPRFFFFGGGDSSSSRRRRTAAAARRARAFSTRPSSSSAATEGGLTRRAASSAPAECPRAACRQARTRPRRRRQIDGSARSCPSSLARPA